MNLNFWPFKRRIKRRIKLRINYKSGISQIVSVSDWEVGTTGNWDLANFNFKDMKPRCPYLGANNIESIWRIG